jgi:hypothetical protein
MHNADTMCMLSKCKYVDLLENYNKFMKQITSLYRRVHERIKIIPFTMSHNCHNYLNMPENYWSQCQFQITENGEILVNSLVFCYF